MINFVLSFALAFAPVAYAEDSDGLKYFEVPPQDAAVYAPEIIDAYSRGKTFDELLAAIENGIREERAAEPDADISRHVAALADELAKRVAEGKVLAPFKLDFLRAYLGAHFDQEADRQAAAGKVAAALLQSPGLLRLDRIIREARVEVDFPNRKGSELAQAQLNQIGQIAGVACRVSAGGEAQSNLDCLLGEVQNFRAGKVRVTWGSVVWGGLKGATYGFFLSTLGTSIALLANGGTIPALMLTIPPVGALLGTAVGAVRAAGGRADRQAVDRLRDLLLVEFYKASSVPTNCDADLR
jgi:hypothetical protein